MKRFKSIWADARVWILNSWEYIKFHAKHIFETLSHDIKIDVNHDLRLFVFVLVYIVFSAVGAYNFAHLTAFLYIIWLLEQRNGKK